jgi:hypothetical protein
VAHVTRPFGDVRLCELDRMAGDIVGCILEYPSVRYGIVRAALRRW